MQLNLFTEVPTWTPPRVADLPNISGAPILGFDTETHDPQLMELGPGFITRGSYPIGVSISVPGFSTYLPLRHYSGNVDDPEQAVRWLKAMLKGSGIKIAANIHYDLDALATIGVDVNGELYDIQTNEALINPGEMSFSLESIAQRRLGRGKLDVRLKQYLIDTKITMSQLRMTDSAVVAGYAIEDSDLLLPIYKSQQADIAKYNLGRASTRENQLTRVLWKMHQKGVRVDVNKAEEINDSMAKRADEFLAEANRLSGMRINPGSSKMLAGLYKSLGLTVPLTAKGNPSISNNDLKFSDNPILRSIYEYRRLNKIRRDFIEGVFLKYAHNGRVYPQWFQSRHEKEGEDGETGGAETGRITGAKPNLTQIPSRDPELGPLCRQLVLPEEGSLYCKGDFSSQEPRWTLHFAYILGHDGAAEARDLFIKDKTTDFHQVTRDMVYDRSGVELTRREAKDINLGLTYGMGKWKLAGKLGLEIEKAEALFAVYHRSVPFIKATAQSASDRAQEEGLIRTWGGRIRHFDEWESTQWDSHKLYDSREACMASEGSARRAKTHKALNSAVQGTAADQMKQALIDLDAAGELPILQVYDECGFSVDSEAQGQRNCEIMENALLGEIPALVEPSFGRNWGEAK